MLWMLCRRLPWSWGEGFLSKKRRKAISEKAVLSAPLIPAGTGSCSPALVLGYLFFHTIAQLARKGAIAQSSLQVVTQSGSLFKDLNSLRRRGALISIGIAVPLSHRDRMTGHPLSEEAKITTKGAIAGKVWGRAGGSSRRQEAATSPLYVTLGSFTAPLPHHTFTQRSTMIIVSWPIFPFALFHRSLISQPTPSCFWLRHAPRATFNTHPLWRAPALLGQGQWGGLRWHTH